ncbi:MAG: efflux RND transporter periplasmic adaptor subunit [Verrucomicrobia bacterium]|nr:efflux RND transporter periplasmic adaptor subunit [Verrucomicrobiota bacterium]
MKAALLLSVLALAAGCRRPEPVAPAATLPVLTVHTAAVRAAAEPRTQAVPGVVRPFARATVAARVMGGVESARLTVGQAVRAGEVLVRINADELTARREAARAALAQAEREHTREADLLGKGASTADALRLSLDQLHLAEAHVHEAEALLGYTAVTAPFDGVITEYLVRAGDLATPGQPLFTVEGTADLRAEVTVPESLPALPPGTAVRLELASGAVEGQLVELSPAADAASRTRLARIALPADTAARSGEFVRAAWPAGGATVLLVPASAVQSFGQMDRVFVVNHRHAQLRLVRPGATTGGETQILAGLDAGETVVVAPPAGLRDSQPLRTQP